MAINTSGVRAGRAYVVIDAVDATGHVLKAVQRKFNRWGQDMQSLGRNLSFGTIAAAIPQVLASRKFMAFDDAMRRVEARAQDTTATMGELREEAMLLGRTTAFSAVQVAKAMDTLALKGYQRAQLKQMMGSVVAFARAGGSGDLDEDIGLSATLISGMLKAFNLDASETERVANALTVAVNNSNLSMEDLVTSMQYASSIAGLFNTDLEETLAFISGIRDLNIHPSIAGTSFRNIQLRLTDPKKLEEFNQELAKLGIGAIEFSDAAKNLRKPATLMFEIFRALDGLGTSQKGAFLDKLIGKRGIIGAIAIGKNAEQYGKMIHMLRNLNDDAAKTQKLMDDGLGGTVRFVISAMETLAISIGTALEPALMSMGNELHSTILPGLIMWVNNNQQTVASIMAVTVAVGLLGAGLIIFGTILRSLAILIGIPIAILGFFSSVLGLLGTIIGTVGGVLLSTVTFLVSKIVLVVSTGMQFVALMVRTGMMSVSAAALTSSGVIIAIFAAVALAIATVYHVVSTMIDGIYRGVMAATVIMKEGLLKNVNNVLIGWNAVTAAFQAGDIEGALAIAAGSIKVIWAEMIGSMWKSFNYMVMEIRKSIHELIQQFQTVLYWAKVAADPIGEAAKMGLEAFLGQSGGQPERDYYDDFLDAEKRRREWQARESASAEAGANDAIRESQRRRSQADWKNKLDIFNREQENQDRLNDALNNLPKLNDVQPPAALEDLETNMPKTLSVAGGNVGPQLGALQGTMEAVRRIWESREATERIESQLAEAVGLLGNIATNTSNPAQFQGV